MAEVDYQMALLLQNKFEQENRDSQLAKTLQRQFEKENGIGNPYENNSNVSDAILAKALQDQFQTEVEVDRPGKNLVYDNCNSRNSRQTKSLTDPSWEVIDPTPDIHTLFIAFNEKFFWNGLGTVCVSWSKRMTTCAGICSYQGRGGMCTITLSEPLLKLRPRKDLVETLLHEMIHAYLFITNNNRDRDGHGPEFHKHMKRINAEAGTNITVYHNFHDEVDLYKQHWWRCNGPCQKRRPYFGLVRRAVNRAPGPYDFWWAEHSKTCGGQFIKVKEPEKQVKAKNSKFQRNSSSKLPDIKKYFPSDKPHKSTTNNIQAADKTIKKVLSNLETDQKSKHSIEIKTGKELNKNDTLPSNTAIKSQSNNSIAGINYAVVRNHWINKFPNTSNVAQETSSSIKTSQKRPSLDLSSSSAEKREKLSEPSTRCPVCFTNVPENKINVHLDECLGKNESKDCHICGVSVLIKNFKKHLSDCLADSFNDNVFDEPFIENVLTSETKDNKKKCDICKQNLNEAEFDIHLSNCLHGMFNKIEEQLGNTPSSSTSDVNENLNVKVECLACGKKIFKSNLNTHLEDCMNLSNIFDIANEPLEGTKDETQLYNCPSCVQLFSEEKMNEHIDICFGINKNL